MNVCVAILATLADVGKHHLYVASCASHSSMHAAQRIAGLTVIELRNRADRPPSIRGMAILAGNCQLAMRTVSAFVGLCSCTSHKPGKCKKQEDNEFGRSPSAHGLHLAFVPFTPKIQTSRR